MRRVLSSTAVVVAFLLPPLSVDVCMHAKCRVQGGLLTSGVGRRRPPTSRSGRDVGLHRVLNRCPVFKNLDRTELSQALLDQGELLWGSSDQFEVLEVRGACSRGVDVAWSGGNAERSSVFAFFAKCGTVEVCVVFLETLTPVFELYVRLRERR
ncbi:hypothetical protein Taro_026491 [Colocasia esculenta]|uniref:Uncharacterized protein n=1 Tax=Colocasia esculenta TaxID=4460 RepID=A0A843VFC9_COLES|nr:hypothetical protein [Colocasia esculenta]